MISYTYFNELCNKYNLVEQIVKTSGFTFYYYYSNFCPDYFIFSWVKDSNYINIADSLVIFDNSIHVKSYSKEYYFNNIENLLINYTKIVKNLKIQLKINDLSKDFNE